MFPATVLPAGPEDAELAPAPAPPSVRQCGSRAAPPQRRARGWSHAKVSPRRVRRAQGCTLPGTECLIPGGHMGNLSLGSGREHGAK